MSKLYSLWVAGVMAFALSAWAQDTTTPPATDNPQDNPQTNQQGPMAPYGQENAPPPISENPPITGLDLPGLEPHSAPLSYLQPGATFSESADTNVGNALGGQQSVRSVSRALGSLTLQRLWSHYDLALDYIGGAGYYNVKGIGFKALQQGDIDQKITWKRGQFSLRDSFNYLPEGNFGGAYGSLGSQGIASLGNTSFGPLLTGASFAGLGDVARLVNVSTADISENLTPKSALTVLGGYALTHFYGNDPASFPVGPYLNSTEIAGQVGYDRIVTPHTQVALSYGYQGFDFSTFGTAFHSHVIQTMYGHRISGRMDFLIGAGPQFIDLRTSQPVCTIGGIPTGIPPSLCTQNQGTVTTVVNKAQRVGVAGQARLRYKFQRASADLLYQRYVTSGSGIFAGAQTDMARLGLDRPLSRVWSISTDLGFSRNQRLQAPAGGIAATTFSDGFAGVAFHRAFGHDFHGFASYQFNELLFSQSFCVTGTACSRISNRHVGTIGLDWTPRPMRID